MSETDAGFPQMSIDFEIADFSQNRFVMEGEALRRSEVLISVNSIKKSLLA